MANIFIFGCFLAIIRFLMFGGRCNRDIIMKTKILYKCKKADTILYIGFFVIIILFYAFPDKAWCMDAAALRPSPIARITVAPPRTISPPAYRSGMSERIVS